MNLIKKSKKNSVSSQNDSGKIRRKYIISEIENREIDCLLQKLVEKHKDFEASSFLINAQYYANQFPQGIVFEINKFKYYEDHCVVLEIVGFKIVDKDGDLKLLDNIAGLTPLSHFDDESNIYLHKMNLFLVLINSLLGDAFAWSTQHNGRLVNNILPLPGNENSQLSTGSTAPLEWHTEEAFHEFRPDVLSLMCLRNSDNVSTDICSISDIELPSNIKKVLFQKRFVFLSDDNFDNDNNRELRPEAVLFGNYESPYIRIDPAFMRVKETDFEAKKCLDFIVNEINNNLSSIYLNSGDICFINNNRVVHGRKQFRPRFDGTDRWLKRIITTRDLKKSRILRDNDVSRIINSSFNI